MHKHDYETIIDAQQGVRKAGYTEEFKWTDDHRFTDASGEKAYQAGELTMVQHYRFEGMSNPGDMSIFMVLEAKDGKRGYVISAYGPYADEKLTDFLDEIPKRETPIVKDEL